MKDRHNQFNIKVHENTVLHPEWRHGQVLFNTLRDEYPELAEEVRSQVFDPFHRSDGELTQFYNWLADKFEEMP